MTKYLVMMVAALSALILAPAAASAQTGYQLDNVSASNVQPGGTVTVYANGFAPGSTATITLESDPVLLDTVTAGTDGVVNATVTVPASTPVGTHQIVIRGTDRDGNAKVVSFQITVGSGGSSSGLPSTGVNTGLGLAVAAIAIGVGAILLKSSRRRDITV